jgi:hypothetical protein
MSNNKYKATNKEQSTIRLTQQRANYRIQAFKNELGEVPNNVVKFNFAERTLYGRVDENLNTIYPNRNSLKMLPNDNEILYVMDFVYEPFRLLQNKMEQATFMKQIPNDPILSQMTPYVAYQEPLGLYLDYMESYLSTYNNTLDKSKIINYESWVNQFFYWTKRNGPQFPLTYSNFHRTKKSNIFASGLAISIAELDSGNDPIKEDLFLNNKTLEFYLNAAKQFGFSVSKDSPWLLVSDLNSPASIIYHKNYNLSSINQIFTEKYSLCYVRDRDLLQQILEFGFKEYVNINKFKKELKINKCNNININKIIYNNNINNIIYNNSYYNRLYIMARNIEEYSAYSSAELDRIIKNSEIFEKKLDKSEAMSYTNEQFRKLVTKRPGGLYSIQQKQQLASEDK